MRSRMRALSVFLLIGLCGCAGLRISAAKKQVAIVEDVPYVVGSQDQKHRLDLYLPRGGARFPVVLFVHGGFWRNQDRRYLQGLTGLYGNLGVALGRRGIGVAVQSYRLFPQVGIREQIADVLSAIRWVQANIGAHGGDPGRLVLAGYSAGGHLVTLLGLDPRHQQQAGLDPARIRGYVALSGLLDLQAMAAGHDEAWNRDLTDRLFGRSAEEIGRYSPASYLRRDAPPMLLLAGEKDYPYVKSAGRAAAERLTALGARAVYEELPGHSHAQMVLHLNSKSDRASDRIAAFVREVTGP